jgi:hypothetical protein
MPSYSRITKGRDSSDGSGAVVAEYRVAGVALDSVVCILHVRGLQPEITWRGNESEGSVTSLDTAKSMVMALGNAIALAEKWRDEGHA